MPTRSEQLHTVPPGVTVRLTAAPAQANLRIVLEQCALGRLRCSEKTRRPTAASVGALASLLVDGDYYPDTAIAAYAWPLLVQAGGLAELAGTRLQLTAKGRRALSAPAHATIRGLWAKWVSSGIIDEFSRVEHILGQRSANVLTSATTRRRSVAAALSVVPADTWIGVDALFARMRRGTMSPTIARSERSVWKLYLVEREYGSLGYDGYGGWEILEGRYTLAVLFEYAGTLGLLDLMYIDPTGARDDFRHMWGADELPYLSRYDGLLEVRLSELGAWVTGLTDAPPTPPEHEALRVGSNLEVVAVGDLPPGDAMTLSAFGERTGDRTWQLSMDGLLAAIAAGRDLEDLRVLLQRGNDAIPASVQRLMADAAGRASALTDRGVVRLVECDDPATAVLIARDRRTAPYCAILGERHLAVPAEHDVTFREALDRLGYALAATGDDRAGSSRKRCRAR